MAEHNLSSLPFWSLTLLFSQQVTVFPSETIINIEPLIQVTPLIRLITLLSLLIFKEIFMIFKKYYVLLEIIR